MVASGLSVSAAGVEAYQKLKLKKDFTYIIYTISEDFSEIVVEKTSTSGDYDDFLADLPEDGARHAVYYLEFEKGGAGKQAKIISIAWSPDGAKIKQKMILASSNEELQRVLTGVGVEIQATDISEVSYEAVVDKAS
ncbi:actin-binding ADF family protein [Streptomyces eurythermus]|uniref:actin-binding ADF family protein n=1 Tax=Streptomyces eurythermus TaxID=42237 RepID=UPI0036C15568